MAVGSSLLPSLLSSLLLGLALVGCDGSAPVDADKTAAGLGAGQQRAQTTGGAPLASVVSGMEGVLDTTHFHGIKSEWSRSIDDGSSPTTPSSTAPKVASAPGSQRSGSSVRVPGAGFSGAGFFGGGLIGAGLGGLRTRQAVAADGNGQYAIEFIELIDPPAGTDEFKFQMMFESAVDALWHVREFRVRDIGLVQQNYSVSVPGDSQTIAGIQCQRVQLSRFANLGARPGRYDVFVDPATGFVLAMVEYDALGLPLQAFHYESFSYGGDLSSFSLRTGAFNATAIDLSQPLFPQVGFRALVPDVFPDGFQLFGGSAFAFREPPSAAQLEEPFLMAGKWVRFDATDGIELLRFAHAEAVRVDPIDLEKESVLRTVSEGTWEIAFAKVRGVTLIATGRVGMESLRLMVDSAL